MIARKLIAASLFAALTSGAAFAQAQQPATTTNPLKPPPAATAPATSAPAGKAAEPAKSPAKAAEPAKPAAKAAEPAKPAAAPAAKAAEPAKKAEPAKPAAAGKKIDLNTATAAELDTLPQIGEARAKAIIEARAKGKFKNWDDFVKRNVVPSNAESAIKDLVKF